jgi:hypothetical protein
VSGRHRRQDRWAQSWYLLALKGNQPTLEADVADYFSSAPPEELVIKDAEIEKGHGRIEMRTYTASSNVDWIVSAAGRERREAGYDPNCDPTSRESSSSDSATVRFVLRKRLKSRYIRFGHNKAACRLR